MTTAITRASRLSRHVSSVYSPSATVRASIPPERHRPEGTPLVHGHPDSSEVLLHQRHWQTYRAFKTEYDRIARTIDGDLAGTWPSRAQLHRWLSGNVKRLPYPDHCRVLEAMFPGWNAQQLFEPADDSDRPNEPESPPAAVLPGEPQPVSSDEKPAERRPLAAGVNYRAGESDLDPRVATSHDGWLRTRRLLNQHRMDLTHAVARLYPESIRLANTGILMPEAWRLDTPVDLTTIDLAWQDAPAPGTSGQQRETRPLRPLTEPGQPYRKYSRAMRDLDRPRLFENRVCYRLLDVDQPERGTPGLTLGNMCYFDMIDVGESLAHETAYAATAGNGTVDHERLSWQNLPFRRMIRDPFDLTGYPLMLSISTLTVRQSRAGTTFLMLRRNPAKVAIAGGMLSVMPTGVFQPASVVPAPNSPDFDLWRNMMREYSEEFLGNPEHDGDGPPIDYATTEPFRSLEAARQAGKIRIYCLGFGIDALNYVGDVLTVAVFDADTFDDLFEGLVDHNDEGTIVTADRERREFTFDHDTIQRLLTTEPLAPSGAACLHLAWQHHATIIN